MSNKSANVSFKLSNPVHFLALGFGTGLLRPAPGTWGTLAAIPLYLLVAHSAMINTIAFAALLVGMFFLGVYLCGQTSRDVGVDDHSAIVWDEIVGFFITMFAVSPSWTNIAIGFVLFRLFDISKPWPIRAIDRSLHGGLGIMLDDVLAGIFACAVLHGLLLVI